MSGDLQARKRNKDKKKRKDSDDARASAEYRKLSLKDEEDVVKEKHPAPSGVHSTKMGPDDIQLHVHSEHGTGGHWCAKLVFFSLMAVLLGLVGLILLENRGLSDLDTPLSESRFADILEGWVDEEREGHDHDEHDLLKNLNELDDHGDAHEPFSEEEDHDDEEEEDSTQHKNDHDHDQDDDEGVESEDQHDQEADDDNEDDAVNDDEDDNLADDDNNTGEEVDEPDNEDENDDEAIVKRETIQKDDDNDDNEDEGFEDDNADDDESENDNEIENEVDEDDDDRDVKETQTETQNEDDVNDDDNDPFDERVTNSAKVSKGKTLTQNINKKPEQPKKVTDQTQRITPSILEKQVDELVENFKKLSETLNLPTNSAIYGGKTVSENMGERKPGLRKRSTDKKEDDEDNSIEEVIDNDEGEDQHLQKLAQKDEAVDEAEDEEEQDVSGSTNNKIAVAVKIVVGLALLVVAYQFLVRKTQTSDNDGEDLADMRRRLTLITGDEAILLNTGDDNHRMDVRETIEDLQEEYPEDNEELGEEEEYSDEDDVAIDENDGTIEDIEADERIIPQTYEQMEALYKPARRSIGELVIPKNVGPQLIETKIEQVGLVIPRSNVQDTTSSTQPEPRSDEGEDLSGEEEEDDEDIEYSDEEEYDDDEEDEISDVDDTDLLKRLEAKYGKLPQKHSDDEEDDIDPTWTKISRSGPAAYDDDFGAEDELGRASDRLEDDPNVALTLYEKILQTRPKFAGALIGRAKALDRLAETKKSNLFLRQAIEAYAKAIDMIGTKLNDDEFKGIAERCIERQRFIGQHLKAVPLHEKIIERFGDDPYYRNQLAVTYLLVNRLSEAKLVLHETLLRWRNDGFAAVNYGFVLKTLDKNLESAVTFLREGIESGAEGTNDGRFYFHLGDALTRLGRTDEAKKIYKLGAINKVFLSEHQRSLYNVDHLKSRPFWTIAESGYKKHFRVLEDNWQQIRDEALSILNQDGYFVDEAESLRDFGDWKQFELFARGQKNTKNCQKTPFTCKLIETFPDARLCKRGQVKFSVMHPNTHVWPHCGPTNCRLRAHLGLKVPAETYLRVATELKTWKEGKIMIFDDSFEHEVWHNGTAVRLVFIVDVWHPDLSAEERTNLYPI